MAEQGQHIGHPNRRIAVQIEGAVRAAPKLTWTASRLRCPQPRRCPSPRHKGRWVESHPKPSDKSSTNKVHRPPTIVPKCLQRNWFSHQMVGGHQHAPGSPDMHSLDLDSSQGLSWNARSCGFLKGTIDREDVRVVVVLRRSPNTRANPDSSMHTAVYSSHAMAGRRAPILRSSGQKGEQPPR